MKYFCSLNVRKLLHNKFVVVLGDSIQRSVYKDLVKLLQDDDLLSDTQIRFRGEMSFEKDKLVEGGELAGMHNGTTYREVRQYRTDHHLVRFYFLTRVYSTYMESVLSDFRSGPQPDVLIVNSCVWDLTRYDDNHLEAYKTNLDVLFQRLREVLSPECLIVWNMTMPVGDRVDEVPEYTASNMRTDIVEGNFFSATLANFHKLDVLDMHYHFRRNLRLRCRDAVHWNPWAHRKYTQILLTHIARAWGVKAPRGKNPAGFMVHDAPPHLVSLRNEPYPRPNRTIHDWECYRQADFPVVPHSPLLNANMSPNYFTSPGSPVPYPRPDPTIHGRERGGPADSPFMTDSPPLNANMSPNYFTSPGSLVPYPRPDPTIHGRERCGPADSPFMTDSPPLNANMSPNYFTSPGSMVHGASPHLAALRQDPYPRPHSTIYGPGPAINRHPFTGRPFLLPTMPPNTNFTPFPNHAPYPQEAWNMNIRPREGWANPNPRPLMQMPGIY